MPGGNIDLQAFFQNAHGAGKRKKCVFMQLITHDMTPEHKGPGTYMGAGLKYRDQWESKLVRPSRWSPLF